jgi:heme exporter protein B
MQGFTAIVRKDLMIELRGGHTTIALVVLSGLILVVLVMAFNAASHRATELAAGALWVALIVAGVLGSNSVIAAERENQCIRGLRLSPIDPATIYAAKLCSAFIFMTVAEIATVTLLVLFFNLNFGGELAILIPVLILGTAGFSALSTLLSAICSQTRAGELLLPLLIVPVFVPALIAGVKASEILLNNGSLGEVMTWLKILVAFDVLFVTAGYLLFEYVIRED